MKTDRATIWSACVLGTFLVVITPLSGRADESATIKAQLINPPRQYSTGPLWTWNDLLTEEQIKSTLADLASQRVKQVFEAWSNLPELFLKCLDAQRILFADEMADACYQVIRTLCRPEPCNAIFDLQLIDLLRLMIAAPRHAQFCLGSKRTHEAEPRAQLRIR